jgi:SAM-dependent methyltransferase
MGGEDVGTYTRTWAHPHRAKGRLVRKLRPSPDVTRLFASIEEELDGYTHLLNGRVLNAGAGNRDISHLVSGELVNQDIPHGNHPGHVDIWSPLEEIPVDDGQFDAAVCNAVLEHVTDPERVIAELSRVLHPGGVLYLCVPFMQPEHLDPVDNQRYTLGGLHNLCARHGLDVRQGGPVHSADTALGWVLNTWLQGETRLGHLVLGRIAYHALARRAAKSRHQVAAVASAYRVVAVKR